MFFPIKLEGHNRLKESDREPMQDSDATEPILTVVDGEVPEGESAVEAETAIVPNAFETVLAKYDENHIPKYVEPEAPAYKNRAFIAAICIVGGIVAGRLTTQPKIETRIVNKDRPVLVASENPTAKEPQLNNAFRDLADLKEFDPWQPMNGGFPLPPKSTQANIVSRSGSSNANFNPAPPSMRGSIEPMNPNDVVGPLPKIGGPGIALPANPEPGGKASTKTSNDGNPTSVVGATKPEVLGKERYVSMSVSGTEPSQGQNAISGIASTSGGSTRKFSHMNEDGSVEAQGVLVIIPASQFESVKSKIEALGGASVESNIEGNASSEQSRIQSVFTTRLAKLREKQKDLLVDFLEDAQPVKQIKEAIDLETRAVSATRLPSGLVGKVVIRVMLK